MDQSKLLSPTAVTLVRQDDCVWINWKDWGETSL